MNKINIAGRTSSGVQQINSTINEMDGITQENAQYAENIKISQTTAEQAIIWESMNMFKVSEDQPRLLNQISANWNGFWGKTGSAGQQKEVNVKDFEEKDNFK